MPFTSGDNYFQLLGIKPAFDICHDELSQHHQKLQSILHPDRHIAAGPQQQRVAARNAALVNEAYRVLNDDCERAIYLLQMNNISYDPEHNTVAEADFLTEQMEWREYIEEYAEAPQKLSQLRTTLDVKMQNLGNQFSQAYTDDDFDRARTQIIKMQFLKKLIQQIENRLQIAETQV